jgi:chromosome partitioning protein
MKVIVLASGKGGVGKTTLAFNLAIEVARAGNTVYLIDRDPAEALSRFCKKRKEDGDLPPDNPMRLENVAAVAQAVDQLKLHGYERDYVIVDTPNAFMPIIREAIAAADCVILPVEASPIDILVNEDVVAEVDKLGKRDVSIYVINPADARSSIASETVQVLKPLSPNPPLKIAQRVDYRRAMINGQAATEINADARKEILGLWNAIQKVMRKANGHQVRKDDRSNVSTGKRVERGQ